MKKQRTVEQEYLECDGCIYVMGEELRIELVVPWGYPIDIGDDEQLTFHFHAMTLRHDCFRHWAHNPRIMKRSLTERGFSPQQIDDFMELMLYRENSYSPGVEKPKEKASA